MGITSIVLLICSMVALSSACCTPDQWEGVESSLGGYARIFHHGLIQEYIDVAYDAVNNRTAAVLDYRNGKFSNKYRIVTRYDNDASTGKLYVLDIKKEKCWTKTLNRPFRKACIPAEAKALGTYSVGLVGGLNATAYEVRYKQIVAYVSVQDLGNDVCVPVGEAIYGKLKKVDFIQNVGFINITPGIRNETVFDVPKQCQEDDDYNLAEEFSREHYIMAV
uniref:Mammalian ependymin-related protein 1 n=1 Tax=Arion vulgaris TaxID=1028688 RepID=A0A0B7B9J2_9EUPU